MALVKAETVNGFAGLPPLRQVGLMVGLAASVALGVAVVLWAQKPTYSLLYGSLSEQDAAQVAEALQKANIPYRIDPGSGALLVPARQVRQARLKLAGEGLPRGAGGGFELLDKDQGFGTSQFVQNARYQHALEGELARTISELDNVRAARVHLALPRRTAFLRRNEVATASVMVELYSGRRLAADQVAAIAHLVASSVPRLDARHVTVVDQHGSLLSSPGHRGLEGLTASQFAYAGKLEQSYADRVRALLEPLVGPGKVKAEVAVDLDFTEVERTEESYDPDSKALRSEQVVEETRNEPAAGGVPGTLSNTPPPAGKAPVKATAGTQGVAGGGTGTAEKSSSKRSIRNFELAKTISHTRLPAGKLRKLSIAVVLDDKVVKGKDGKLKRQPWSDQEIARFSAIVKGALGFDAQRGDQLQIVSAPFQPLPKPEPLPAPPIWKQPWFWDLARQVGGALGVLLLLFGVLRPLLRNLADNGKALEAAAQALPAGEEPAEDQLSLSGPGAQGTLPGPGDRLDDQLSVVQNMAREDPKRVAQVMKNWVNDGA